MTATCTGCAIVLALAVGTVVFGLWDWVERRRWKRWRYWVP